MNPCSSVFLRRAARVGHRALLMAGFFLAGQAHAGTHTWSGNGATALWSNAANWSSGGAPVAGESNVVIVFPSNASAFTSTPNVSNLSVDRLEFEPPSVGATAWTITNAGTPLTLSGAAGDNVRLTAAGTTVIWQSALTLQNTCRVNAASVSSLDIQGTVAGVGGVVKLGGGTMKFSTGGAANTFTGLLSVQAGGLTLDKIVGTPCFGGNLEIAGGTVSIGRSHQIPDTAAISISAGGLVTAPSSGVASVTEVIGPLTLSPTILADHLRVTSPNSITLGGNVTLAAGNIVARFRADAPSGQIGLGGATRTLTVPTAGARIEIDGNVVDGGAAAGIVKQGAGDLEFRNATSFSGPLTVAAGRVLVLDGQALGATAGATIVQAGATLELGTASSGVTLPAAETLQLAGTLTAASDSTVPGSVVLSGSPTLSAAFPKTLTLSGIVSGSPTTTTIAGQGTVAFTGTAGNTLGGTLVVSGSLNLGKTAGLAAVPGSIHFNAGSLKLLESNQIPDSASIVWDGAGNFNLNSQTETLSRMDGAVGGVRLLLGDGTLTLTGSADATLGIDTTSGRASVAGSPLARLRKLGSGTLTLNHTRPSGASEFPILSVEAGTVMLFSEWLGSIELKGGILRGKAATGPLVGMGGSLCLCDFDAAAFSGPATVLASINGDTPGTGYDQLTVNGSIDLTGQTLQLSLGAFTPMTSGTFRIIDNASGSPITGTFAGLPEGAPVTINGQPFRITYRGGSLGRSVVLRFEGVGTPGPEILSVRPIAGGLVEVKVHWLPGKFVRLERAAKGLTSWGVQNSGVLDANGDATLTFNRFGSTEEFVRLAID